MMGNKAFTAAFLLLLVAGIQGQTWYSINHRPCPETYPGAFMQLRSDSDSCQGNECILFGGYRVAFQLYMRTGYTSPSLTLLVTAEMFGQEVVLINSLIPNSEVVVDTLYLLNFDLIPSTDLYDLGRLPTTIKILNTQGGEMHVCGIIDIEVKRPPSVQVSIIPA